VEVDLDIHEKEICTEVDLASNDERKIRERNLKHLKEKRFFELKAKLVKLFVKFNFSKQCFEIL
jgi:hypothetical protein